MTRVEVYVPRWTGLVKGLIFPFVVLVLRCCP